MKRQSNMKALSRLPRHQAGFNLIEVLVALLIFSLGLAGVAALLVNGMAVAGTANIRSEAVTYAQTGVEMMRSNMGAYTTGWYDGTNTSGAAPALVTCTGSCDADETANNDFAEWRTRLANSLPAGTGFICMDSSPDDGQPAALACDGNGTNVIKIFWADSRDTESLGAGEDFHRFSTAVVP